MPAWYDGGGGDGATIIVVVVLLQRRGPSPLPPDDDDDVEYDVVLFLREEARMGDAFMVMGRPFRVIRPWRSGRSIRSAKQGTKENIKLN